MSGLVVDRLRDMASISGAVSGVVSGVVSGAVVVLMGAIRQAVVTQRLLG